MPRLNTRNYNTTDLDPEQSFERHVFHRDMFAHYLRWVHILKDARRGDTIVDFGCGKGALLEVFYRNRHVPGSYTGFDIRGQTIAKNRERFASVPFPCRFESVDLTKEPVETFQGLDADKVCSFEVIEHVGKCNVQRFLERFAACGNEDSVYYLSTPNYDPRVGAADNHTYDAGDGFGRQPQEWEHSELEHELREAGFKVERRFGTFASQRDYKAALTPAQQEVYEQLKEYYDSTLISVIMGPIVPAELARNCLWVLSHE